MISAWAALASRASAAGAATKALSKAPKLIKAPSKRVLQAVRSCFPACIAPAAVVM
jgi:hypothetical protein